MDYYSQEGGSNGGDKSANNNKNIITSPRNLAEDKNTEDKGVDGELLRKSQNSTGSKIVHSTENDENPY